MDEKEKSPLWGGRFAATPAEVFGRLNASIPFDIRLAPYDIQGSIAHARMLGKQGIVSEKESAELVQGLETVLEEVGSGEFSWTLADEDVHTAVERRLRELVGDVAMKLHTGRSRNDQVALDLHLFVRDAAGEIGRRLLEAMRALVEVAEENRDLILPGYTHLQRAQPILLSHHLLAHFEVFRRDLRRLEAAREAANVSPLGAAALGGTPHPIDTAATAEELGMQPFSNSLDAVSERDFALDLLYACAVLGVHLSRMGEEWVLWTSQEFWVRNARRFLLFGILDHAAEKNPDAYELMRGKSGRLTGDLNTLLITLKGFAARLLERPPGRQRTYLRRGGRRVRDARRATGDASYGVFSWRTDGGGRRGIRAGDGIGDFLAARGVPFREAHRAVGTLVKRCEELGVGLEEVPRQELSAAHPALAEMPEGLLTPRGSVTNKKSAGSTSPGSVENQIRRAREFLAGVSNSRVGYSSLRTQTPRKGVPSEDSPDVGHSRRRRREIQAGSPGERDRGDQSSGAGPGGGRRRPDRRRSPERVRAGQRVPGPPGVPERPVHDGQPRCQHVGYRYFEELFDTRSNSTTIASSKGEAKVVAMDSTKPDLDEGEVDGNTTALDRLRVRGLGKGSQIFLIHHHLLAVPGTGRDSNILRDAGDVLALLREVEVDLVLSGHRHVPYVWSISGVRIVHSGTASSERIRGTIGPSFNL